MGFLQECQTNMNSTKKKKGKRKSIVYEMGCVLNLMRLWLWVCVMGQSSIPVILSQGSGGGGSGNVEEGSVFIDGRVAIASTDDDFICATLDWWPPDKCDYGTCSWATSSLLNLVTLSHLYSPVFLIDMSVSIEIVRASPAVI